MTAHPQLRPGRGLQVKRLVAAGFGVLLTLVVALTAAQLVVGGRLRNDQARRTAQLAGFRDTNRQVLQYMTDAETAVRGFQLTGDTAFLATYDSGRAGAYDALERLAGTADDAGVRRLLAGERAAAEKWLYGYAIPIVNAGTADADGARLARGTALFEQVRTANADVDAGVDTEQWAAARTEAGRTGRSGLIFAALALLILLAGFELAVLHQRAVFTPLEELRRTLGRLRDGDLSARAVPSGPAELRVVAEALNGLAAETERLIAAEKIQAAGNELRDAVAAEFREERPYGETSRRVVALIGAAFGASAVHGRVTVLGHADIHIAWPADDAPPLPAEVVAAAGAAAPGAAVVLPGGLAVAISGDTGCPSGLIGLVRAGRPEFTEAERQLLEAVGRDVDFEVRRRRLHRRQSRLIEELRALDERKDSFVSTVTHELRTPLTSILGYSELLTDAEAGELSPLHRRGAEAILRNALRLDATVADLLVLDRSNERIGAMSGPVDLAALAAALHAELGPATRAKGLQTVFTAGPAWVNGVGVQLERALRNLIENAIKFTPAGGRVRIGLDAAGDRVVVTVDDTGIGIPAGDVPGLFTPFHRAANAMDQAVQGSGLGLAIVRAIVTEHGGTVAARSEEGRGSTFTLTLPALSLADRPRSGRG